MPKPASRCRAFLRDFRFAVGEILLEQHNFKQKFQGRRAVCDTPFGLHFYVKYPTPAEPSFFLTKRGFINAIIC